jgi:hypothetical protein
MNFIKLTFSFDFFFKVRAYEARSVWVEKLERSWIFWSKTLVNRCFHAYLHRMRVRADIAWGLPRNDAALVFCCLEGGWLQAWELETVQCGAENGCHARRVGLRRKALRCCMSPQCLHTLLLPDKSPSPDVTTWTKNRTTTASEGYSVPIFISTYLPLVKP